MRRTKIKTAVITLLLTLCWALGTVTAQAAEKHTPSEIAAKTVFITFKKGYTEDRGNYLGAAFFFPDEYYEDGYAYGVAVFPEKYIEKYNLTGDYLRRKEEEGIAIMVFCGTGGKTEDGRMCSYNVCKIPEKSYDMRLAYVLYITGEDGETAYKAPVISSYNEAELENPTTAQLLSLAVVRQREMATEESLAAITDNIKGLASSVWIYSVIAFSSVAVIWGAYIGIRLIIAKKTEQKADAKGMLKRYGIGIGIAFILAVILPLIINGLAGWSGG